MAEHWNSGKRSGRRKAIAGYTSTALAAIYGDFGDGTGELWASGAFIEILGQLYLLTAGHVAVGKIGFKRLTHSTVNATESRNITRGFRVLGKEPWGADDLAITRLDPDALEGTSRKAISVNEFGSSVAIGSKEPLFLHGFPKRLSIPMNAIGRVSSTTLPMETVLATSKYPWFDPAKHFAVGYRRIGHDRDGNIHKLPEPYGLSGSLVWRPHGIDNEQDWLNTNARVIGLLHAWDDVEESIVATRIEVIREFITRHLREEFAFSRWCKNGNPPNSALDDWKAAEDAVPPV